LCASSKAEMFKKTLNFFFNAQVETYENLKLYYFKHFIFNVNNLNNEVTGVQYMPVRDRLNYKP